MAEAIGLVASIITIIDTLGAAKSTYKKYIHSTSSVRKELIPLLGKLTAFSGILHGIQLQCELDESDDGRLQILQHIYQPLEASHQAVQLISARLDETVKRQSSALFLGKIIDKKTAAALSIIDQARGVLDLALAADQRVLVKSIETYLQNVTQDLRDVRLESESSHQQIKDALHELTDHKVKDEDAKIKQDVLDWITQVDYQSNLNLAIAKTQQADNSGEWFLSGEAFQKWCAGGNTGCNRLLLRGPSGCGKTVLCAKAIKYVWRTHAKDILYFFFDFNDIAKQTVDSMLRSLLRQLVARLNAIPREILECFELYKRSRGTMDAGMQPQSINWCDLLCRGLVEWVGDTYIFIDALDECEESQHTALSQALSVLSHGGSGRQRWMLTCRPRETRLGPLQDLDFKTVAMDSKQIKPDIKDFLSTALLTDPKLSSFTEEARESICSAIASCAGGMFRYAQCQLDTISKLRDRRTKNVKEVLRTMPKDIFSSYEMILRQAQAQDDWELLERVLGLVILSARPVSLVEAAEFAVLEDGMSNIDSEDRLDLSDSVSCVDTLITVSNGNLALAHQSVQAFFTKITDSGVHVPGFNLPQLTDDYIGKRCLQYLGFPQKPVSEIEEAREVKEPNATQLETLLNRYPFMDYAARWWPYHLRGESVQQQLIPQMELALPLRSPPNLWKAWLMLQRADIWESQVRLARFVCEASIRASKLQDWAAGFWRVRQAYRVLSRTTQIEHKVTPTASDPEAKPAASTPGEHKTVLQQTEYTNCLTGMWYYDLALLLLEIALQTRLFERFKAVLTQSFAKADLHSDLQQLHRLKRLAAEKMGQQYGKVISSCLKNVKWASRPGSEDPIDQAQAMANLCEPLEGMLLSGFRVSRKPPKRHWNDEIRHNPPTVSLDGLGAGRATDGTYRAHSSRDHTTWSSSGVLRPNTGGRFSATPHSSDRYQPQTTSGFVPMDGVEYETELASALSPRRVQGLGSAHPQPGLTDATALPETIVALDDEWDESLNDVFRAFQKPVPRRRGTGAALPTRAAQPTKAALPAEILGVVKTGYFGPGHNWVYPTETFEKLLATSSIAQQDRVVWVYPEKLQFDPYLSTQLWGDVPFSDSWVETMLTNAEDHVLKLGDITERLAWSREVHDHLDVVETNKRRTMAAVNWTAPPSEAQVRLRRNASLVLNSLRDSGLSGAPALQKIYPRWDEHLVDIPECVVDPLKSGTQHILAADKGRSLLESEAPMSNDQSITSDHQQSLYERAMALLKNEFDQALDTQYGLHLLREVAEQDQTDKSRDARYTLGMLYAHRGSEIDLPTDLVPLDLQAAHDYLSSAAYHGHARAQFVVGSAYETGDLYFPVSPALSLHYHLLSASRGLAEAELAIHGIMLTCSEILGSKALEIAFVFCARAASGGWPQASRSLSLLYEFGVGVETNLDKALELMQRVANSGEEGSEDSLERLRTKIQNRDKQEEAEAMQE